MASVKDFVPTPEELKGQKLGGEKMAETAFSKTPQPAAPKQMGGVTAKVSSFTPSAEELAAQRYDTVGAKGRQPGMQTLAAKERIAASGGAARPSAVAEVSAPELRASMQRGVEPMTKLQFATEKTPFEMAPVKGGYEHIPQQKAGIFKTRPSAIKMYADFAAQGAAAREAVPTPSQFAYEKFAGVGPKSDVRPMTAGEAQLVESMERAKKAGAGRVAEARMGVGAAEAAKTAKTAGAAPVTPGAPPSSSAAWAAESQAVPASKIGAGLKSAGAKALSAAEKAGSVWGIASQFSEPSSVEQVMRIKAAQGDKNAQRIVEGGGVNPILESAKQPIRSANEYLAGKIAGIFSGAQGAATKPQPATTQAVAQQPVAPEQPAKPAAQPMTTQADNLAVGAQLQGGGTVGNQEPAIDFSQNPKTVPLKQGETEMQRANQIEKTAQEKGQAVSRGEGGNFRYVQGPNGQIIKQNTDTKEVVPMSVQGITGNILKPGEESPLAREARTRKETAFRDALVRQAFQPIDANTNVADVGTIKRNREVAQQLLSQLDAKQAAEGQLGMEEKKLASTERATAATQEQNRLYKEADAKYKQEKLGLEERKTQAAEEAAKSKPRTVVYKGEKLQGTPEDIEIGKQQLDAKIAGQWDKKNPKPSGILTTNDDVIKHYEKRAKELGYDSDVSTAANLAQRIQGNLQAMSPEDREEVNRQFQSKYGVPYSEFIVSE